MFVGDSKEKACTNICHCQFDLKTLSPAAGKIFYLTVVKLELLTVVILTIVECEITWSFGMLI